MKSVLVIGGYGGFGTRLCRRLVSDGWDVIVAGRNLAKAKALAAELAAAEAATFDREGDIETALSAIAPDLVIDAAGPFQGSDYRVPHACIALGIHCLDLADARDFVTGIGALDESAKAAGVTIISGASSVPALSGAVLRQLANGMTAVSRADIAISASDRATAGTSVASAILSYAGQPISIWEGRQWQTRFGLQHIKHASVSTEQGARLSRLVACADVPDLDIVPRALPGNPSTTFSAGPEFRFQVWALWLLSWLVRWGWLSSLVNLSRLLLPLQSLTRPISDGKSFMTVEICGTAASGYEKRRWELLATDGRGPEIPTMATQLLARALKSNTLTHGARHAGAELSLDAFLPLLADLEITTRTTRKPYGPLYKRIMGSDFDRLPGPVRAMHELCGDGGATGSATVTRGQNPIARLIAALLRFPPAGTHDLHVSFREDNGCEVWERDFGGATFQSEMSERRGLICERFGPLRFFMDLPCDQQGLRMELRRWTGFGVPLPLFLAPRIEASETADADDFLFDVAITLPMIGEIVHYRGRLRHTANLP